MIVIEPGAVTTELVDHITHGETKQAIEQFYEATSITADDIAQIIAFAVSRPRSVSINELLVRPTAQASRSVAITGTLSRRGRRRVAAPHTSARLPVVRVQLWSVVRAGSARSSVAAQLPSRFSASSDREPGSAA